MSASAAAAAAAVSDSASSPTKPFSPVAQPVALELGDDVIVQVQPEDEAWLLQPVGFLKAPRVLIRDGQKWACVNAGSFREEEPVTRKLRTVDFKALTQQFPGERQKAIDLYALRWLNYRKWIARALSLTDEDTRLLQEEIDTAENPGARRSREIEKDVRAFAELLAEVDPRRDGEGWGYYLNFVLFYVIGHAATRKTWSEDLHRRTYLYLLSRLNKIAVRRVLDEQGAPVIANTHLLCTALSGLFVFVSSVPSVVGAAGTMMFEIKSVVFDEDPTKVTVFNRVDGAHLQCSRCGGDAPCAHQLFLLSWLGLKPEELSPPRPLHVAECLTSAFLHRLSKSWTTFDHPTVPFLDTILTIRLHELGEKTFAQLAQMFRAQLENTQALRSQVEGRPSLAAVFQQANPNEKDPEKALRIEREWSVSFHWEWSRRSLSMLDSPLVSLSLSLSALSAERTSSRKRLLSTARAVSSVTTSAAGRNTRREPRNLSPVRSAAALLPPSPARHPSSARQLPAAAAAHPPPPLDLSAPMKSSTSATASRCGGRRASNRRPSTDPA